MDNEGLRARHNESQQAFQELIYVLADTFDQDWQEKAACKDSNPEVFFVERGQTHLVRAAKAICDICVVKAECLEYAIDRPNVNGGIWGGTVLRERINLRKTKLDEEKRAS